MKDNRRARLLTAVGIFSAAVFVVDVLTPAGVEVWVLYLPVILAPVWYNNARHVVLASATCSALVVIGSFFSHPYPIGELIWLDLLNRGMGLMAMWLTAYAGITLCRRSARLGEVMENLRQEIAHHKKTEEALTQSEERLRLAAEGAGMGTWDVNLRTGKAIWSETHFRTLGYPPAPGGQATHSMWRSCVHADDLERILEAREQARRERTPYCAEYRIRRADSGAIVWLAIFGRFVEDDTGAPVRFLGVSFDITRRKVLEREVLDIAAREQRRIGQELHDSVGQEITGLGLMANVLVRRLQDRVTERQIAGRLITQLDRVHQQVRALSRGLVPVQVEAKGLWAALDDLAVAASEQSGITVTFDCPEWEEGPDHATATELFRIAQEAVSNALRHGQPQHVRLSLFVGNDGLHLSVRDNGAGMKDSVDESNGMGLRIMRYRAGLIGGVLHIDPAQGGGTVVTCVLPNWRGNNIEEPSNGQGRPEDPDRG